MQLNRYKDGAVYTEYSKRILDFFIHRNDGKNLISTHNITCNAHNIHGTQLWKTIEFTSLSNLKYILIITLHNLSFPLLIYYDNKRMPSVFEIIDNTYITHFMSHPTTQDNKETTSCNILMQES